MASRFQQDMQEIRLILERNTSSLETHMKRTDALEKSVEHLKSFTAKWAGAWTLLGGFGTMAGIAVAVGRFLGKI